MRIIVAGGGGYVGGRLVPRLLEAGHDLTVISRQPAMVAYRFPQARTLGMDGDGINLPSSAAGTEVIYSLPETISRYGSPGWSGEIALARALGAAAQELGARQIVHLSELGEAPADASAPARGGRSAAGEALAASGLPVLEFRTSLIIGSGSAPFEMIRHLADHVAVMTTPRWVELQAQPIAIRDVLACLVAALQRGGDGPVEIGGPDVLAFAEMLSTYAEIRGLRRVRIPLPIATPWASDVWISLVSPLPRGVAAAIIDRLRNGAVPRPGHLPADFGASEISYRDAVTLALERIRTNEVETAWFDTFEAPGKSRAAGRRVIPRAAGQPLAAAQTGTPEASEGRMLVDHREVIVPAGCARVFVELERLGGRAGWPAANPLWRLRGLLDRLVGGLGMRLGRRDQGQLRIGDVVDFWRVEMLERPRLLRLRAEMRVPGDAWLQFEVAEQDGGCRLAQTAYFSPDGLLGYLYWYVLLPLHRPIFRNMIRVLAQRASQGA